MPSRLAVIPGRGGSKRIPDRNIRMHCGKPMIGQIPQAAAGLRLFDAIDVSIESQRIADVVESLGRTIYFLRPQHLAGDHNGINLQLDRLYKQTREPDVR